ncbi:hypothetical protein TCON_1714 [Astathelohania contejeani]|uniref:Uncharacterized protein n=1 Tax=Astathelohania contejeani TaxID=164912 RepID=A0ABQ7HY54_9MICR|nr:hypothetical protein TCON_1714 [Thelohania contejeani]
MHKHKALKDLLNRWNALNKSMIKLEKKEKEEEHAKQLREYIEKNDIDNAIILHKKIHNDILQQKSNEFIIEELNEAIKYNNRFKIKKIIDGIVDDTELYLHCRTILINYIIEKTDKITQPSKLVFVINEFIKDFKLGDILINILEEALLSFMGKAETLHDEATPIDFDRWIDESVKLKETLDENFPQFRYEKLKDIYQKMEIKYFKSCLNGPYFKDENSEDLRFLIRKIFKRSKIMGRSINLKEATFASSYLSKEDVYRMIDSILI